MRFPGARERPFRDSLLQEFQADFVVPLDRVPNALRTSNGTESRRYGRVTVGEHGSGRRCRG